MALPRTTSVDYSDWAGRSLEFILLRREMTASSRSVYVRVVKPAIDVLGGLTLLIVTAPIMAAVSVIVGLKIGRPIIFSQERIGFDGEPFRLYKFRTMIPDRRQRDCEFSGDNRRLVHKAPSDPRVVSAGARLRALRLDELPQIWNILNGDMSLVGPRPEMPDIVEKYADWQHLRHVVKPGLTGLWQVSEHNDRLMFECTDIDLDYVASIGPIADVSILMRTPFAMVRRGGY